MTRARRGILYAATTAVAAAPLCVWLLSQFLTGTPVPVTVAVAYAARSATSESAATTSGDTLEALAARDPLALVRIGHERYEREIRDYRCVLIKQELLDGTLSAAQEVEVRVRHAPRAIYMLWRKNATEVRRALWRDDPDFVDEHGQPVARVEPAGAVVRLFVTDILMPIRGERAQKSSRRSIDECGFATIFDLMEHYCELARQKGVLDLRYGGAGEVDGRPTMVLVRHLPYSGDGGPYPDGKLVLHLDREWLLPVATESYADPGGKQLLGRYVFTKVELNPGLSEKDFEF